MHRILLLTLIFLQTCHVGGQICEPGKSWVQGKFKLECYTNGTKLGIRSVACIPSGKTGGTEYPAGNSWTENTFKYKCERTETGLRAAIAGCLTPDTNQEIPLNGSLPVPGKGIYRCTRQPNGAILRDISPGCIRDSKLYPLNSIWTEQNYKYICISKNGQYQAVPVKIQAATTPGPRKTSIRPSDKPAVSKVTQKPTAEAPLCKPGSVWMDGNYKIECFSNDLEIGYQAVACVPSGQLGGKEYFPGQYWTDGNFKYYCGQDKDGKLSYSLAACLTPTNQEIRVGESIAVPNQGLYECRIKPNGVISLNRQLGCVNNGKFIAYKTTWNSGNSQLSCVFSNEKFQAKATACLTPDKTPVAINTYKMIGDKYFKCVINQQDSQKADFVEVTSG